jgi:hypothetical protein
MLQGMALKAKKKKEPFAKTLNDYLEIQIDNGAINSGREKRYPRSLEKKSTGSYLYRSFNEIN